VHVLYKGWIVTVAKELALNSTVYEWMERSRINYRISMNERIFAMDIKEDS
jgi:hypothetical protein